MLRQGKQFLNFFLRQGAIENREFVEPTVPHIEIVLFRRIASKVEFRADAKRLYLRIGMEAVIGLRSDLLTVSVQPQSRAIGDKRDQMPLIQRQGDILSGNHLFAAVVLDVYLQVSVVLVETEMKLAPVVRPSPVLRNAGPARAAAGMNPRHDA